MEQQDVNNLREVEMFLIAANIFKHAKGEVSKNLIFTTFVQRNFNHIAKAISHLEGMFYRTTSLYDPMTIETKVKNIRYILDKINDIPYEDFNEILTIINRTQKEK